MERIHKIGRRKSAVARIYMNEGKGALTINGRDYKEYFPTKIMQYKITQPFLLTENVDKYDIKANVFGGGNTGQVEAIRLAISRALCEVDEKNKKSLKAEGLMTRDSRVVERKKFGQKKARKKFQFSKR